MGTTAPVAQLAQPTQSQLPKNAFQMMNVVHHSPKNMVTDQDIDIWKRAGILPADAPKEQVLIFAANCADLRLSPTRKQIMLLDMWRGGIGKIYITYVTNDGLRVLLNRSGKYAGCAETVFDKKSDGTFKMYADAAENLTKGVFPLTCTFTGLAYGKGGRFLEFTKTVRFAEFYKTTKSGDGSWEKMPLQMIEKVAKSFVYKEMLGEDFSGVMVDADVESLEFANELPPTAIIESKPPISSQHAEFIEAVKRIAQNANTEQDFINAVELVKSDFRVNRVSEVKEAAAIAKTKLGELRAKAKQPPQEIPF